MTNHVSGAENAQSVSADASALGYLALGLMLLAFGLLNTDVIDDTTVSDASRIALYVGGITQFIAGMWEFYRGRSFNGTAFASLGAFWVTWSAAADATVSKEAAGLFMLLWALLALSLTVAGWQSGAVVQLAFGLLTVALALLGVSAFAENTDLGKIAGWVAVASGAVAWYAATASLTNATWGRKALPFDGWRIALPHRHVGGTT